MEVKHEHPVYINESERLQHLQEVKSICLSKLNAFHPQSKKSV